MLSIVGVFVQTIRPSNCGRLSLNALTQTQKRFAGGGGRPGGRPAFSWKDKQQLRLSNKLIKKDVTLRKSGDFSEIASLIDPSRGDLFVDISKLNEYTMPEMKTESKKELGKYEGDNNTRKQIRISALFGSQKHFGPLTKKHNAEGRTFSHRRLYASKQSKQAAIEGNAKK